MRRMERITGRTNDMIILRGVNLFPTQIEDILLKTEWCGRHFQIELTREDQLDRMMIKAEALPEFWALRHARRDGGDYRAGQEPARRVGQRGDRATRSDRALGRQGAPGHRLARTLT
jgi:phenylacetate-coenzyme A ligase PaaK-like adenylate-forming protein